MKAELKDLKCKSATVTLSNSTACEKIEFT